MNMQTIQNTLSQIEIVPLYTIWSRWWWYSVELICKKYKVLLGGGGILLDSFTKSIRYYLGGGVNTFSQNQKVPALCDGFKEIVP